MKRGMLMPGLVVLLLAGCAETFNDGPPVKQQTKENADYHVSLSTIRALTGMGAETRGDGEEARKLVCIKDAANDTLLYMCDNEGGGWKIYSSDTRVPPIVAESETGTIEDALKNDSRRAWIYSLSKDMKAIRNSADEELSFSKSDIETHKKFWCSVSNPDSYMKTMAKKPDSLTLKDPNPVIINWEDYGHWEILYSEYSEDIIDYVPRRTLTSWHQGDPYNTYCPLVCDGINYYRGLAGCVAIAGAQILYYLHYAFGIPTTAPSEAYCNGVFPNQNWMQYNYSMDVWGKMNLNGIYAAPLIADVGRRVNMQYGYEIKNNKTLLASWAVSKDLVDNVFLPYGIQCEYSDYDDDVLASNLLGGIPVIIRADGVDTQGISAGGHAFICDRYKKSRKKYIVTYRWVYDRYPQTSDGKFIPIPIVPDKEEITYETDYLPMVGMNWGWGDGKGEDEEWYYSTGSWLEHNNNIAWKNGREMIHSFSCVQ